MSRDERLAFLDPVYARAVRARDHLPMTMEEVEGMRQDARRRLEIALAEIGVILCALCEDGRRTFSELELHASLEAEAFEAAARAGLLRRIEYACTRTVMFVAPQEQIR